MKWRVWDITEGRTVDGSMARKPALHAWRWANSDNTFLSGKSSQLAANSTMSVVTVPDFYSYLISASLALAIRA
jgi:hypothetical protein